MSSRRLTRRGALGAFASAAGALGLGFALRGRLDSPPPAARPAGAGFAQGPGASPTPSAPGMMGGSSGPPMMGGGAGMMGGVTQADMASYMDMFNRHREIRRGVEEIPGGVRTRTESDAPELATQLKGHVSAMYAHLEAGAEVRCMSQSLPTLFARAPDYQRRISFTPTGVIVEETSADPALTQAIRAHAREVSGFVNEGMAAMMAQMMRPGPGR